MSRSIGLSTRRSGALKIIAGGIIFPGARANEDGEDRGAAVLSIISKTG